MNNIKQTLVFLTLTIIGFYSCETHETANVSSVTTFPIIMLNGKQVIILEKGTNYTELGAVSKVGDDEIETETSYSNGLYFGNDGVDINSPDKYESIYSATNEDGFDGSASRVIWVAEKSSDLSTNLSGIYTADVQRAPDFTPLAQYDDLTYVLIVSKEGGEFEITHALGGYYDFGRGFGENYAARGATIKQNIDGSYSITQAKFPIWGNTVDITDFNVDNINKTITYTGTGNFGNGQFKVQLTQVDF